MFEVKLIHISLGCVGTVVGVVLDSISFEHPGLFSNHFMMTDMSTDTNFRLNSFRIYPTYDLYFVFSISFAQGNGGYSVRVRSNMIENFWKLNCSLRD